ncbi:MAG: hypothetical protein HY820_16535 [Acidobacteria bacterium]|nr:hypothetical protein [Acidobacteriota bacterium]
MAEELVGGSVVEENWTTHHYGYDDGLHVRQLSDAAEAVAESYLYDAFGNWRRVSPPAVRVRNRFGDSCGNRLPNGL